MALKGKSDNGNQLYLHYKYDSSILSFSKKKEGKKKGLI